MSSFLTEVDGFTPIIDVVANELGLIPAAVYGVVWRYCQMKDGRCWATQKTMAEKLGLDQATVQRHLHALCLAGYIEDATPDLRNKSHTYRDTGRVEIVGLVQARYALRIEDINHDAERIVTMQSASSRCRESYEETSKIQEETTTPVAVAPVASELPVKKPRAAKKEPSATTTAENGIRREAERFFIEETGLKPPSDAKASSAAVRWWAPLRQICELGDWDAFKVNPLIQRTVRYMRANHLTISAPQSIVNVATALQAEASLRAREQAPVASSGDKPWWADGGCLVTPVQSRHSGREDG